MCCGNPGNDRDGVHLHRVRDEDAGLSVRVIDRKLHGDNRAVVFQRGNLDVEPQLGQIAKVGATALS